MGKFLITISFIGLTFVTSSVASAAVSLPAESNFSSGSVLRSEDLTALLRGVKELQTLLTGAVQNSIIGPVVKVISSMPRQSSNDDDRNEVFKGDFSQVFSAERMTITGAATLQRPSTGYANNPHASGHYMVYELSGTGHNQSKNSNDGRTAAKAYETDMFHGGQGDLVAYNGYGEIFSSNPGASHWLANPAVVLMNGDLGISSPLGAHGYLNGTEINLADGGYEAAAVGHVVNLLRNANLAQLGEIWMGTRIQSNGSKQSDVAYSAAGKFKRGLDFGTADFGSTNAAISLSEGQRIYFNGKSSPLQGVNWYNTDVGDISLFAAASRLKASAGGKDILTVAPNGVGIGKNPETALDVKALAGNLNAVQVFAPSGGILAAIFSDGSESAWLRLFANAGIESIRLNTAGSSYINGGNVGIGTINPSQKLEVAGPAVATAWNLASDARLKKNVRHLDNALESISKIRGVLFNWIDGKRGTRDEVGVIAQEVETTYPQLVTTDSDGMKSVDYAKLTPILLEAIKELDQKNSALEARIQALEKRSQ